MTAPFSFTFTHGPELVSGLDRSRTLATQLDALGVERPMLVTDETLVEVGVLEPAIESLEGAGRPYALFDEVEPNPRSVTVERGAERAVDEGVDGIVAVGGGSSIDAGKAIAVLAPNGGEWADYGGTPDVDRSSLPTVCVPTTVGTGSEVTPGTVITDAERDVKVTTRSPELFADVALLDPALCESLPPRVTAATGMDSLTQAIEAYLNPEANPITDALALEAVRLLGRSLRPAVAGTDLEALAELQVATAMEGIAFHNAGLGLVHGLSEPVSGAFHTGHGITNAVLLPVVLEFNLIACPDRYARLAEAMGVRTEGLSTREAAGAFVDAVRELADDVDIPAGLEELGVDRDALPELADEAVDHGNSLENPRVASRAQLLELYERAFVDESRQSTKNAL
ncbi:iron-containing alcohol dehydrogenase [Natronobeatus ordinarius]|uniref:iron-containing alcohol dehydrogenase n=1 Tax=Natronobeatus ordinarius TaxID=2963433 RepID=UPI0020CCF68F|nr:iron-containing alcohol dehydrogenase [Natronobeatus ordinarius]